ncbi:jg4500 [Pararge aegeria aegeria]|uniref:Jg4500 protein n=1 Tax=Pararge aegeria aegeria TaxID=348720 RepID=A0A8S4R2P1_9NEOP|nr:jg4500 [Pararge aegeria aegeria]
MLENKNTLSIKKIIRKNIHPPLAGLLNAQATSGQGSRVRNLLAIRAVLRTTAFCIRPLIQQPSESFKIAKQDKRRKYENLDSRFIFVPFGVETLGPWGPEARALFKELSKGVIKSTCDPRAGSWPWPTN